ncbi:MAG: CHRD domain-containing protein [Terriglobales bacterium]
MLSSLSRRTVLALAGVACFVLAGSATAATMSFKVPLSGAQQVPAVMTPAKGTADLTWDPSTRTVKWHITYSNAASAITMAHFHDGAMGKNGPVKIWLTKKGSPVASPIDGEATLTPDQAKQFEAGMWYINVHSKDHPSGVIRGQVKMPKG